MMLRMYTENAKNNIHIIPSTLSLFLFINSNMKILNILEANFETKVNHRKSDNTGRDKPRWDDKQYNTEKSGNFGKVYSTNDPFSVTKVPHEPTYLETDGYYQYIKAVVDGKLAQSNPYYPRVQSIETVSDKENNSRYKIKLEPLQEIRDVDSKIIISIFEDLFPVDFKNIHGDGDNLEATVDTLLMGSFLRFLDEKSPNKKYNEVVELVTKLSNRRNMIDMSSKNAMIRLSPYPQLVITDPLA